MDMLSAVLGILQKAIDERLEAGAQIMLDFEEGKLPKREEVLILIGAIEFVGEINYLHPQFYQPLVDDLYKVLEVIEDEK